VGVPEPPRPDPVIAFVAAAIALMVMPLVMLIGLSALALAAGFLGSADHPSSLSNSWLVLGLFGGWVLVVGVVVLTFAPRWARRIMRP
jgi:hypothetical protein